MITSENFHQTQSMNICFKNYPHTILCRYLPSKTQQMAHFLQVISGVSGIQKYCQTPENLMLQQKILPAVNPKYFFTHIFLMFIKRHFFSSTISKISSITTHRLLFISSATRGTGFDLLSQQQQPDLIEDAYGRGSGQEDL